MHLAADDPYAALATLDAELAAGGLVASLGPGRPRATSLVELAACQSAGLGCGFSRAVANAIVRIVRAVRRAFPHNLFWDFDHLVAALVAEAHAASDPHLAFDGAVDAIVGLQDQFGHETAISFRYVHDFLYGFDWAKWVAKDPPARADIGPYDARFVAVMRERGQALIEAISTGADSKYPAIPSGRHRNPFGFSRAPRAELVLHRHLARRALIPVEAWRPNAKPQWNRDFAELRRIEAHALGLTELDDDVSVESP